MQLDLENLDNEPSLPTDPNMRRPKLRLTPEGLVFLIILAFIIFGALLRNVNLLIVLAGMMFSAITLNWRSAKLKSRTVTGFRELPARVYAGKLFSVIWRINNDSVQRVWNFNVEDRIDSAISTTDSLDDSDVPPQSMPGRPGILGRLRQQISDSINRHRRKKPNEVRLNFPQISPHNTESNIFHCLLNQRGRYRVGPSKISTTFPFGLIEVELFIDNQQIIYAAPPTGKLVSDWERRAAAMANGSQSVKRKRGNNDDEFFALRQWRSGDNRKNIHWRTTAKMQQPMVRQFDEPTHRDVAIVIDLFQPTSGDSHPTTEPQDQIQDQAQTQPLSHPHSQTSSQLSETVLSFASTIAANTNHEFTGDTSIAICGQTSEVFQNIKRKKNNASLMRCLAMAQSSQSPDLFSAITAVGESVSPGTPIFIISTREQPQWVQQFETVSDRPGQHGVNDVFQWLADPDLKLGRLIEQIRWVDASSNQFSELFTTSSPADQSRIEQFQRRWS